VRRVEFHPVDQLIDEFVATVNARPHERQAEQDVPAALRRGKPDGSWLNWEVCPSNDANWLGAFEAKLPARLPPSFRSLVSRYAFPSIKVPPIQLLPNTGENVYYEFRNRVFADKSLAEILLQNGLLQFAQPAEGDYDPVCFDTKRRASSGECPIVRVDHEEILCNSRIKIRQEIAPSFPDLLHKFSKGPT